MDLEPAVEVLIIQQSLELQMIQMIFHYLDIQTQALIGTEELVLIGVISDIIMEKHYQHQVSDLYYDRDNTLPPVTTGTQIYNGAPMATMFFTQPFNFNRFRIRKSTTNNSYTDYITLKELQIWIGNTNVAPLFTTIDTNDPKENQPRPPINFINEVIDDGEIGLWHSTEISNQSTNEIYATFTANTYYNTTTLQCIVLHDRVTGHNNRILGVKIELMKDDIVLYEYTVVNDERIIRLDGPAIVTAPSSMFTSSTSTTQIYNGNPKEYIIFSDVESRIIEVVAEEPWTTYSANQNIGGGNGGSGWTANWVNLSNNWKYVSIGEGIPYVMSTSSGWGTCYENYLYKIQVLYILNTMHIQIDTHMQSSLAYFLFINGARPNINTVVLWNNSGNVTLRYKKKLIYLVQHHLLL